MTSLSVRVSNSHCRWWFDEGGEPGVEDSFQHIPRNGFVLELSDAATFFDYFIEFHNKSVFDCYGFVLAAACRDEIHTREYKQQRPQL